MIAAGTESMSMIPMLGRLALNEAVFERGENVGIAYGMGLTAEKVAAQWKVSREAQDAFALASHRKALAAQECHEFADEITPFAVAEDVPDLAAGGRRYATKDVARDEGPRADTTAEGLAKLRPVFAAKGSRDRRQQLADVRRRGRVDPRFRARAARARLGAARALRRLRGRGRRTRDHGRRPDRGDSQGAEDDRHQARRDRLDRAQRGVRRAGAGGDARPRPRSRESEPAWAAPSRSGIRSARPARSARQPSRTACAGASRSTAWCRCASAPAWARRAYSKRCNRGRKACAIL